MSVAATSPLALPSATSLLCSVEPSCASLCDEPLVQRRALLRCPLRLALLGSDKPSCAAQRRTSCAAISPLVERRALLCCPAASLLCGDESAATSPLVLPSDEPSCAATSPLVQRRVLLCGDESAATNSLLRRRGLCFDDEPSGAAHFGAAMSFSVSGSTTSYDKLLLSEILLRRLALKCGAAL